MCFFRVLLGRPVPDELAPARAAPAPLPAKASPAAPARPDLRAGAVAALAVLQRDGRLVDFLLEDIDGYSDEQVGAAVREVHRGSRRALKEHFQLEPVRREAEGSKVGVEAGFDPGAIRLTGEVAGEPPFSGTLRHPGWRATKVELPSLADGIVAPAEVEL